MKRGMDPFRAVPLLEVQEKVECVAFAGDSLYIGTSLGNLVQFEVPSSGRASEDLPTARRRGAVRLSQKKPVEQVCAASGFVFALVDSVLTVHPADLESAPGVELSREAKGMCIHTGLERAEERTGQSQEAPEVCLALKKKLVLFEHNGRSFVQRQEFPTSEAACALAWHQSWICAGFRREYNLYSDRAGVPREICHLDGKHAPQIVVLPGNELLLLIQENVGLFYNLSTQQPSTKSTVTWPRKVGHLGAAGNYVFGGTGVGQIDIFGIRDQKNCQTLSLDGSTGAMCRASGGRMLVAAGSSVTCLDPVPFERQVQKLLLQVRVGDALDLLNATFGPEDPQRQLQLSRFHALAGWALFRDLQFLQAFQHFMYCVDFRIDRVLLFWRRYLPSGWEPASGSARLAAEEGAPEPCDIADFVRGRLKERQPSEADEALASGVSANVGLANAAVTSFLLRQREALLSQERLPAEERTQGANEPGPLLRAMDTALLKLLIESDEDDIRLTQVLECGVRCAVEDCEGFLRERNRLDVLARLWKAHGMFDLVLREWSSMLRRVSEESPVKGPRTSTVQIVAEMADALRSAAGTARGAELLRQYVPQLLDVEPAAVLLVFTGALRPGRQEVSSLTPDEVLELLQGQDSLVLGYLEYVSEKKKDVMSTHHWAQLGLMYVAKAEEEQNLPGAIPGMTPTRKKLQRFLEVASGLEVTTLLPRLEALRLNEERVILCSREEQHGEALRILVEDLNDFQRAETYCRLVMARSTPGFESTEEVNESSAVWDRAASVFASELPAWARPVVFAPPQTKRSSSSSSSPSDGLFADREDMHSRVGGKGREASLGGCRPLMLFLRVLLNAWEGAAARPEEYKKVAAEYREAALSLLMCYAGHRDLPATEVMGMLPSSWPLEALAEYLTKCARIYLHEQRAGMLEENLSSMAYLKTFSALTKERMRKVNITGDRCCPVCNRRFVDKDSVGKAFLAYPNETCVHLQCKEHLSICPKTGRNFSDNISVYCHALSSAPEEDQD
ncbi:unnamed protein product [Polarella glacialis]|uniref:CNH domain-containing protein n=1 Tax=Polarella glacialis TaxID=89957 RepID=A0A813JV29_POLGL|nr:unnamed protein product [Polarella glacialis]